MRILLVNHFTPPDRSPTALLLAGLGDGLARKGWEVDYLGAAQHYRQQKVRGWKRWLRDIKAHAKLLLRGLYGPKPDWVLCLSDPPGLAFTASWVAWLRGARLAHWAMDVYPEIAIALGEIPQGRLSNAVAAAMRHGYRRSSLLVALDDDMAAVLQEACDIRPEVLPPWPPLSSFNSGPLSSSPSQNCIRWLYSGNLGRAHDYVTLLQAQRIVEDQGGGFELVFQGGGPQRDAAISMAQTLDLRHCLWQDYVSSDDLLSSLYNAQVLTATQRSETRGMLWPSKLAVMTLLPRPIIWVGPKNGSIAAMISERSIPSLAVACGDAESLAQWLLSHREKFATETVAKLDENALAATAEHQYQQAVDWWHARLTSIAAS